MRDEFSAFERLADEPVEVGHSVQAGQACFQRLLDGGYQYLGNALRFDYFTFGKTAVQESQFVKAYFGGLLCKPFRAVHILGGSHCNVQVSAP